MGIPRMFPGRATATSGPLLLLLLLLLAGQGQPLPLGEGAQDDILLLLPSELAKRSPLPEAEPGVDGVSLSLTANMDTLRQRLMFAMRNRNQQGGGRDLGLAG